MANKSSSLDVEHVGRGSSAGAKVRITIRLDSEIIDWFRSRVVAKGGGSYQSMINNALRDVVNQGGESLEAVLRRVIREELRNSGGEAEPPVIPRGRL
ncbi:MAG: BrnA antitoxin family protein [Candidatus Aminicenantales bacterium]